VKRAIVLMMLMALLAALPARMTAAGSDTVYCGDLAADDCALLVEAQAKMDALESIVFDATFGFDVVSGDMPLMSAAFSASGALASGVEAIDAVKNEILDLRVRDVLALVEDPEALVAALLDYAERILTAPQMTLDFGVTVVVEDETTGPYHVELRLVDGVVYGTSELLAAGGLPPEQWISLDLVAVTHMVAEALQDPELMSGFMSGIPDGSGMGDMPSGGDMGAGSDEMMAQMNAMFAQIAAIQNNPAWEAMDTDAYNARVLDIQRIEDNEIDGVPVAVFETTLDFGAMAETEEFQSVLADIFALYTFIPEDERDALLEVSLAMMADMTWSMTEAVGLEDGYLYSVGFTGSQTVEPEVFAEAMGAELSIDDIPTQTTTYEFRLTLTDHNQPVEVDAPDAGDVIPLMQLLGLTSPEAE
jgi:hypothetical protein